MKVENILDDLFSRIILELMQKISFYRKILERKTYLCKLEIVAEHIEASRKVEMAVVLVENFERSSLFDFDDFESKFSIDYSSAYVD